MYKNKRVHTYPGLQKLGLLIAIAMQLYFTGCGSADVTTTQTADTIFAQGVEEFNDNNFLEAQRLFDIIKLQYPASKYADDAQFYLAEIQFMKGEYILAAFSYNLLRQAFPASEFAKDALFNAGLCYEELSPSFDRDQEYTKRAIQTYSEFQAFYANDSLSSEAGARIEMLRDKLARREYETAELYLNLESPRSSLIYFDSVISDFPDSKYVEDAFIGKIRVYARLKMTAEALESIRLYKQKYPDGQYLEETDRIAADLHNLTGKIDQ